MTKKIFVGVLLWINIWTNDQTILKRWLIESTNPKNDDYESPIIAYNKEQDALII